MLIKMARRLLSMLVTLFGVAVIIFLVLRLLPGNAVTAQLGVSATEALMRSASSLVG